MNAPKSEGSDWFTQEIQVHESALRAYIRSRFPTLHDVDDVVQDSYLKLLQNPPGAKIVSARAYLFTVAHHAVLKIFRKRRLFSPVPVTSLPDSRLQDQAEDVAGTVHARTQDALVIAAISELPERCRQCFKLRVVEGCSYLEIAQRLGLSEATVRVQVSRGLQRCGEYLRELRENQHP